MRLPQDIAEKLDEFSEQGNNLLEAGNYDDAIAKWNAGLALLPLPEDQWESAEWLHASIGEASLFKEDYEAARDSFQSAVNCSAPNTASFVYYRLGQSWLKLGNQDKAAEYLLQAYMLEGEEIFADDEDDGAECLELLIGRGLI